MTAITAERRTGTTLEIDLTVSLSIDLVDYARAYGLGEDQIGLAAADMDARDYLQSVVADLLLRNPNGRPRTPGTPMTVGADDAGVTLTGSLAETAENL